MGSTKHSNGRCALSSPIAPRGAIGRQPAFARCQKKKPKPRPGYDGKRSVFVGSSYQGQALAGCCAILDSAHFAASLDTAAWPENAGFGYGGNCLSAPMVSQV